MKKISFILILLMVLVIGSGCGSESSDEPNEIQEMSEETTLSEEAGDVEAKEAASSEENDTTSETSKETVAWPVEFKNWDIPIIESATVILADNRSASGNVMTQGINAIVNVTDVNKDTFDAYLKALESSGFVKNDEKSIGDMMLGYDKQLSDGVIEMILVYSDEATTITAYNSAAEAAKASEAGGDVKWPEKLKAVPEFTKGKYKETVEMGGDMVAVSFLDVKDADLDWYRNELKNSGFERQEDSDTEGYLKMEDGYIYTVGFIQEGETLQIIMLSGKL